MATTLTRRLRDAPPDLHGAGEYWGLAWASLEWLEENVQPGWSTLETGSGASTIVIAATGAEHEAITPDPAEEDRMRATCAALGVGSSSVTFRIGLSQDVLPRWQPRPLDLVLIDGAHGFPYPILDWWYLAPHLKVGGVILLDDAYFPAVAAIVDHARSSSAWRLEPAVSFRTACIRKLSDEAPPFLADSDAATGIKMRFGYLPPTRRLVASTRQRVFSTRAGLWAADRARRHRGRRASP